MLNPNDIVGVSFWLISAAMVAATYFFTERDRVKGEVGKLLCLLQLWSLALQRFIISTCEEYGLILVNHL